MALLDDFMISRMTLTTAQLASVGAVAVESTYCEQFVEHLIWSLCDLDELQGKFFTHKLMLSARLELLSHVGGPKITDREQLTRFGQLIGDLKTANEERNAIIHGVWVSRLRVSLADIGSLAPPNLEGKPPEAIKRRLKGEPHIFSANKIEATAKKIARLTNELADFSRHAWADLSWR